MEKLNETRNIVEDIRKRTCLSPDFDSLLVENIYTNYEIEVPGEISDFCELVARSGGRALLVGGCVRDTILSTEMGKGKIQPKDIDVEVYGIQPNDVLSLVDSYFGLEDAGTFGKKFEVIKIYGRGRMFDLDISIPREDNKTGTGSKGFEVSSHPEFNVREAAKRRDLTCNSVSYDPIKKVVYDPFNGISDIKENVLRVTDREKFMEDPVRVLRIMQFAARFDASIPPETEELCRQMMDKDFMWSERRKRILLGGTEEENALSSKLLGKSPVELDDESNNRVYEEFKKLLTKGEKPSIGLEFARRIGLIDRYFPWLAELTITPQEPDWHPEGDVWQHSLQVVDAAADIARRENLNSEQHLVLVLAALCHDLGKPTKTQIKLREGREVITSDGHDKEGGWLSDEFINAFAPKGEENFAEDLRKQIKVLTEEHMRPKFVYDEFKRGQNTRKMLGRLARRLMENGTNVYMLSLLAEADQRGRNGKDNIPFKREEVKDLEEWQTWINNTTTEYRLFEKIPEKIVNGGEIMRNLNIKQGPMVGVLVEWVFDDQLGGIVDDIEVGLEKAREYYRIISQALETVEENGLFVRDELSKTKPKNPQDEILLWLKQDGIKDQVLSYLQK